MVVYGKPEGHFIGNDQKPQFIGKHSVYRVKIKVSKNILLLLFIKGKKT